MNHLTQSLLSRIGWLSCLLTIGFIVTVTADTVAYRLSVARNDAIVGGEVVCDLQMRISSGIAPRTLHSFTLDVYYSPDLAPCADDMATGWAFGAQEGYRTVVAKLDGYYRVLAAGQSVNQQGGGNPPGWLLTNTWQTIVRLKWIIQHVAPLELTVHPATNCAAYFINLSDQPHDLAESYLLTNEGLYQPPAAVKLASFSLSCEGDAVMIDWCTIAEENNLGFNIYRREEDGPFSRINAALIAGKGNSMTLQCYQYRDSTVEAQKWYYYKLEQVDRNGGTQLFGPVKIFYQNAAIPDRFYLQQNFPNPFNEQTMIEYGLPQQAAVRLVLMNLKAEMVREWPVQVRAAGRYRLLWDGKSQDGLSAPNGVYFLRIQRGDETRLIKMIKLK